MGKIDCIIYVIKMFYMSLCITYIFFKITNEKMYRNKKYILILITNFFISLICLVIKINVNQSVFSNLLLYFYINIVLSIMLKRNIGYVMISSIISFSVYYVFYCIAVSFSFLIILLFEVSNKFVNVLIIFILHQIILKSFFMIRRFKNGFQFLNYDIQNNNLDVMLIAISCILIYLYSLVSYNFKIVPNDEVEFIGKNTIIYLYFSIIFFAVILIIIIKETLSLSYKQKILKNTILDYESQIKEKDTQIQKLSDEKYKISKLNHEFYNRQKALMLKVETVLENMNFEAGEEIDLKDKIQALSDEYTGKVKENKLESNLPKTDVEEIDDMFTYMNSECKNNGIEFILQVNGNINHLVNKYIDKSKLVTLIGDHLRDAIIAVNYSENKYKSILAILGIKDDNYEFCIYDSGIEFEIETLDKLGLEPATTHKDSGGTGIGFITTFETLKETKASFILEELNELKENNYTKSLKFIFDNKTRLEIISYRADELNSKLKSNRFNISKSNN